MTREQSMRRHPAGRADRMQRLIDAAQDEQAMELANRDQARLEEWGMAPLRRLNERHHEVSTGPRGWVLDVIAPLGIGLVLFGAIWGTALVGELVGGWPL